MEKKEYLDINRASWNNRLAAHLSSEFYDLPGFLAGQCSLNSIELALLGDLQGKKVLHLQCHFGQDSISLSRRGAEVTGVDLSDQAIAKARELARQCGTNTRFICSDILALPEVLEEEFDLVFTSYGAIPWLADLKPWGDLIARYLKPGGQFVMAEFHPAVWMFDENSGLVNHSYFNCGAMHEVEEGSYADREASISQEYVNWNHSLSDVLSSLLRAGLSLLDFQEYNYSPYDCFEHTEQYAPGRYRIKSLADRVPMVFALCAQKS